MKNFIVNETPVRTSKNFNINNIKLEDVEVPERIKEFNNVKIVGESSKIKIENKEIKPSLTYGLGQSLENLLLNNSNQNLKIDIDSRINKELEINFKFDKDNSVLIDNIEVTSNESAKSTIILKYSSEDDNSYFHNGVIKLLAKKDSNINVIILNLLNEKSNNFLSIENELGENANVNYTIIDFGGKNSISNYYSNLIGNNSKNNISTIYLGNNEQLFDLNYIAELRGEKTDVNIEVQGALNDSSKKHFKGTIDFKKGAKKAKGNENESCMLLSKDARSIALPMLLCSEEDVEGNHSSSSGKADEKVLFYIMSRGLSYKDAMKLLIKAKFNRILESIKNEDLKILVLNEIDKKLKE